MVVAAFVHARFAADDDDALATSSRQGSPLLHDLNTSRIARRGGHTQSERFFFFILNKVWKKKKRRGVAWLVCRRPTFLYLHTGGEGPLFFLHMCNQP